MSEKKSHSWVICQIKGGLFSSLAVVTEAKQDSPGGTQHPKAGNPGLLWD